MSVEIGTVEAILKLKDEFSSKLHDIQTEIQKTNGKVEQAAKSFKGLELGMLGTIVSFGAVVGAIKKVASEAMQAEEASKRLDQALKNNAGAAQQSRQGLEDLAASLQTTTRFSDEMIMSVESVLLRFKNIKGDSFERVTKLVLDMAEAMGGDATSAAMGLGRALEQPGEAMRSLIQIGVILTDGQQRWLKMMRETGRGAEAQAALISLVEQKVGGLAKTMGDTASGQLARLRNALSDVAEQIGEALLPYIKELASWLRDKLNNKAFLEWAREAGKRVREFLKSLEILLKLGVYAIELATKHSAMLAAAVQAIVAIKFAQWIQSVASSLVKMATSAAAATTSTVAAGTAAANSGKMAEAAIHGWTLLATAILLAAEKAAQASRRMQEEMDAMARAQKQTGDAFQAFMETRRKAARGEEVSITGQQADAVRAEIETLQAEIRQLEKVRADANKTVRVKMEGAWMDMQSPGAKAAAERANVDIQRKTELIAKYNDMLAQTKVVVEEGVKAPDIPSIPEDATADLKAHKNAVESLLASFDPVLKAEFELRDAQELLDAAIRNSTPGVEKLKEVVAKMTAELKRLKDQAVENQGVFARGGVAEPVNLLTISTGEMPETVREMDEKLRRYEDYRKLVEKNVKDHERQKELMKEYAKFLGIAVEETKEVKDSFTDWIQAAEALGNILGKTNSKLGQMVKAVANIAASYKAVQNAKSPAEAMMAGAAMGQSVFEVGQGMGFVKGDRGKGQTFGGKMSGDYADIGGQIGGAIGALWGPVGALVGSVLGTVIGGAIKKGADEGLGEIKLVGEQVAAMVTKDEGGLGKHIKGIGKTIVQSIQGVVAILGGELQAMNAIQIKIRDDVVSVFVNGIVKRFKDMNQAINFAVTEALKTAEITGMSKATQQALQKGRFESIEEMMSGLQFIQGLEKATSGMSDLAFAAQNMTVQIKAAEQHLLQMGVSVDEASRLAWGGFLANFQNAVRQATGKGLSKAEQMKMKQQELDVLNAQRKLALAKLRTEIMEVRGAIEMQKSRNSIVRQQFTVWNYELEGFSKYVRERGHLAEVEVSVLEAQLEALLQVEKVLAGMDDLTMADVRMGGGGRRGGGSNWHDRVLAALEGIRDLQKRLVLGELSTFTGREKVAIAKNEVDRLMAQYARGGQQRLRAMEEIGSGGAIEEYLELFSQTFGTTGSYGSEFRRINDFLSMVLEQHGVAPVVKGPFGNDTAANSAAIDAFKTMARFKVGPNGQLQVADGETSFNTRMSLAESRQQSVLAARQVDVLEEIERRLAQGANTNLKPPRTAQAGAAGG